MEPGAGLTALKVPQPLRMKKRDSYHHIYDQNLGLYSSTGVDPANWFHSVCVFLLASPGTFLCGWLPSKCALSLETWQSPRNAAVGCGMESTKFCRKALVKLKLSALVFRKRAASTSSGAKTLRNKHGTGGTSPHLAHCL